MLEKHRIILTATDAAQSSIRCCHFSGGRKKESLNIIRTDTTTPYRSVQRENISNESSISHAVRPQPQAHATYLFWTLFLPYFHSFHSIPPRFRQSGMGYDLKISRIIIPVHDGDQWSSAMLADYMANCRWLEQNNNNNNPSVTCQPALHT